MIDTSLRVEWVVDASGLHRLREQWNALAQQSEPQSVFLRHEWFTAAWQWRRRDSQLRLICVYRDDDLVGICPLIESRDRRFGVNLRSLEFLTVPDTQYCDVLAKATDRHAVMDAICEALESAGDKWDRLHLSYFDRHSPIPSALQVRLASCRFRAKLGKGHVNPFIDLQGGWNAFYGNRSRRLKKANNYVANRIQRVIQTVEVIWISQSSKDPDIDHWLTAAAEISSRSWKRHTKKSLDQSGPGDFIRSLTEEARRNGWLSIWFLLFDGKPVSMEYQLIFRGHVHALRADYDESAHDLSPGTYLSWKLLQTLFEGNFSRYWMGPGENRYKYHWTDSQESLLDLIAYSRTLRGQLVGFLDLRCKPILKRWLKRTNPDPTDIV